MSDLSMEQLLKFHEALNFPKLLQNLWSFSDPRYKDKEEDKKELTQIISC